MSYDMNSLKKTTDKINQISPSFCVAKWNQVTIHLQLGQTHSCHHPSTHKIPLPEIEQDPSALHNTQYKKEQRKKMLEGVRPEECQYCWNIEDADPENFSDRHYKSNDSWAFPYIDSIASQPWDRNVNPTYLEVSFSNVCNFKCSYCSPKFSSKWVEEIEKWGGYNNVGGFNDINWMKSNGDMPIPHRDDNPYVDAFWKWWPQLSKDLIHFRITGGEPLMSKDTFKALDWFIENKTNLHNLSINSNLGVPDKLIDKFIKKIKTISDKDNIKEITIFTSVDGWGEKAAYIRNGMVWDKFWKNVNKILTEVPKLQMVFMSTYNILSVTSFTEFLKQAYDLKIKFSNEFRKGGILVDIPYLRYPLHQKFTLLTPDYRPYIQESLDTMKELEFIRDKSPFQGFHNFEINKFERLLSYWDTNPDKNMLNHLRKQFYNFFSEHDKRRNTNFINTFPEMADFYKLCSQIN